jgi:hypothetical protein
MNRRADDRIEIKLPCQLLFPGIWQFPVAGFTANLHRTGVLVACSLSDMDRELPAVGERASARIGLPANHSFTPKCIECECVLMRVRRAGVGQWQFALRIQSVEFGDWDAQEQRPDDPDCERWQYVV